MIRIVRNEAGNCINFVGASNPSYYNACLSGEVDTEDPTRVNVINDVQTGATGIKQYEFYKIPYTEFEDALGNSFNNATECADYITSQGNVVAVQGVAYYGAWDASLNQPDFQNLTHVAGDFYYVAVEGSTDVNGITEWLMHDSVVYNGTDWERVRNTNVPVSALEGSVFTEYNMHVKAGATGTKTGSALYPYSDLAVAIAAAGDGSTILMSGDFVITDTLTLPADKSLKFVGTEGTCIRYANYEATNNYCFYQSDATVTDKSYEFHNIAFKNAGLYGLRIKSAALVEIKDCIFENNGWSGLALSTTAADDGSNVGYDSDQADLQAFWASANTSNGGAMRIEKAPIVRIMDNHVENNLRGIRIADCGIGGYGYMTRNNSFNNIESGIYLGSSTYNSSAGCENFSVTDNTSRDNANNGILIIGGLNNFVASNVVSGNWNAGVMAWHASNTRFRDMDLKDNNRSEFNGIGNTGDAAASISIEGGTINAAADFIVDVLSCQVYNTGLGSNTDRIGLQIGSGVSSINDLDKSVINIDDASFKGQDYAVDVACDLDLVRLTLGDCRYLDTAVQNVRVSTGSYYELPFSNQHTNAPALDFSLDALKMRVAVKESSSGPVINHYGINELEAEVFGTDIRIKLKDSNKIQFDALPASGATIDGVAVNAVVADAVTELNALFTNVEILGINSAFDVYVKAGFVNAVKDGSPTNPYSDIVTAVAAANDGDSILLNGSFDIAAEITLPADKSLYFHGADGACVQYASYDANNGDVFSYEGDGTKTISFKNLTFKNAGGYGILIKKTAKTEVEDCYFYNNGWDGTALHTVLDSGTSGILGYDSTDTELQAFYAGSNASNGGAMRIEEATAVELIGNVVKNNLRGMRIQDCGVGGYGFITRNVSSQNIESGIYIAAGSTYYGCQNIVVSMNSSAYNANNGLLLIGGLNNKFSQNEVNGNWNAGFCAWGAANSTLRDCGLYDNNRSQYNGIGNTGDAKASIQINEFYNLLGTSISLNEDARFIAEILDTQVHYTGLGSNTEKIGFLITSGVGALADNAKNIIKVDDVGFIGQDYAIDLSEVDISNLRLSLGDNSYQSIVLGAIKPPLAGNYAELPFSNHIMAVPSLDVVVDTLKMSVALKEYTTGNVINVYNMNELQALNMTTHVDIIQKNSDRIQIRGMLPTNTYVNGVLAGNSVSAVTDTLNAAFGMDLTQYKEFLVSEVGVNGDESSGGTLPAQQNNWYIAYGSRATEQTTSAGIILDYADQQPFYNGDALAKGREYTWTHHAPGSYMIGVWSGASSAHGEPDCLEEINWTPGFRFVDGSNRFSGSASSAVDIETRWTAGDNANVTADGQYDVVANVTQLALRYGNDNYLYLLDITGGDEVIIGRSNSTLIGDDVQIFFAGENQHSSSTGSNAQFPVMQERTERWTIVHDYDSSENNEWVDGIESRTMLKSNMYLDPGEKFTFILPSAGLNDHYAIGYTGAATGELTPTTLLTDDWRWDATEIIHNVNGWTFNTEATGYGRNSAYPNKWAVTDGQTHEVSYRHTSANVLEMWSEKDNELIMTLDTNTSGVPVHLYFGSGQGSVPLDKIPVLTKFDLTAVEEGTNVQTWYYIESPDGTFVYPLFTTLAEATTIDTVEGGSGTAQGYSWPDEPTGATWYGPDTSFVLNGTTAPSHGVYGNSTSIIWNEIATDADSTAAPAAFTDATVSLDENTALNFQIHPLDATFTTTIQGGPSWINQSVANANITGTAPWVYGDSTNFPHDDYTVTVVRTNGYGSSTGTLTVRVVNLTALTNLPGTLHTGSIYAQSGTNSTDRVYLGESGQDDLPFVYDLPTALEDGDKYEWYHQDEFMCIGIVSSGVDKTTDIANRYTGYTNWDLFGPITGKPTNDNGQNFGNNYSTIWPGLIPVGWDDNTNPQAIPTRPVYAGSDVWTLYNNAGTLELSLNGTLFRSSSSTHTDPVITIAYPAFPHGNVPFPTFVHTANLASAPTGFTLEHGTMDTSQLLNGDSAVTFDNLTVSPGQRLVVTKSWLNTNVLPYIDGDGGEDNKVFIGIPKASAAWSNVQISDFWGVLRTENQTVNLTKYTSHHTGPTPQTNDLNRFSDTDAHHSFAIEFTREGDLVLMRSIDTDPSLLTEPVGGTFGHSMTWSGAHTTMGSGAQEVAVATRETNTRILLATSGVSVITAPSKANEFDVTEDTFSLPLFNGDPGGDLTLAAGQTYKFWMHDSSIESTDSLGFVLVSDNSAYTTGVTSSGTPGTFGAYVEFAVPSDVPPIKFKWTSDAADSYSTPSISGSTYVTPVTGITLEGPAANQTGTNVMDQYDHGWISLDEQLSAGERLVMDNAFWTDFLAELNESTNMFAIGLKGDNWTNTKEVNAVEAASTGEFFKGDTYIVGSVSGGNYIYFRIYSNGVASNQMLVNTTALHSTVCAFLEISNSGDNIRAAFGRNGDLSVTQGDESTVAYADWSSYKGQTGDQGYGITSKDVVVSFWTYSGGDIDGANIDWTGLSEISVPASTANQTDWNKALDFSGGAEHIYQVSTDANYQPMRMGGLGAIVSAPASAGDTSAHSNARPWAAACVFRTDLNSSNQHIWNLGEGASTNNDNIWLRLASNGRLYFGWGKEGVGYNELYLITLSSSTRYYGIYVAHNGTRLSGSDATATNLAAAFDIRYMADNDSWASLSTNQSTVTDWGNTSLGSSTGVRMDRGFSGNLTMGGRGSNRNFHGKIASMVVTTLERDVAMPTDAEIKLMITDPEKWLTDYKVGNAYRLPGQSTTTTNFQRSSGNGYRATQVWLMGDGSSDSYANGIRNNVYPTEQNHTKMTFNSMQSNDLETVNIPGLT